MSKYADLIYAKTTGLINVKSLFVASYIITADDKICVIKNKRNRINTIGGMADRSDFTNDKFVPLKCLLREWKEEMGIDLNNCSNQFIPIPKYLKIPNSQESLIPLYPVGVLYEVQSSLSEFQIRDI